MKNSQLCGPGSPQTRSVVCAELYCGSIHAAEALGFVVCIYALRGVWDLYSIRFELIVVSYVTILLSVVVIVFQVCFASLPGS